MPGNSSCASTPPQHHHRRKRTSEEPNNDDMGSRGRNALVRPVAARLALLVSLFLSAITAATAGQHNGNAPWGTGRPPREFRMWWRDPSNVLEDLEQFSALYVRAHGCM